MREITGAGADLVVDPVGDRHAEPALRSLRPNGRYLVVGFAGGSIPRLPLNRILLGNRTVIGVDWGAWAGQDAPGNQALIAELLRRVAAGVLHPVAPRTYPSSAPPRRSPNWADGASPESWHSCPSAHDAGSILKRALNPIDVPFGARYCALKLWVLCDYGGLLCRTCLVTFSCACRDASRRFVAGAAGG